MTLMSGWSAPRYTSTRSSICKNACLVLSCTAWDQSICSFYSRRRETQTHRCVCAGYGTFGEWYHEKLFIMCWTRAVIISILVFDCKFYSRFFLG